MYNKILIFIIIMLLLSPIFGIVLAEMLGYQEPIDLAARRLGLRDITELVNWTPLIGYTFPGLPDWLGYVISGFIGVIIILSLGYILKNLISEKV